jgi:hypothetical protein
MVILLGIALSLTAILIGQITMVREMGYSVIALSAADAGIEKILVVKEDPTGEDSSYYSGSLVNGATYEIFVLQQGEEHCTKPEWSYCIKSIGTYPPPPSEGVHRAIEIAY